MEEKEREGKDAGLVGWRWLLQEGGVTSSEAGFFSGRGSRKRHRLRTGSQQLTQQLGG